MMKEELWLIGHVAGCIEYLRLANGLIGSIKSHRSSNRMRWWLFLHILEMDGIASRKW